MLIDCKERIVEIETILRHHDKKYESMGLNHGMLGLSAFYYYYYSLTKDAKYLDDVSNYIALSFDGLNQNYNGFSSVSDIIEIGKYLHFLRRKNILADDINEYLKDADIIISEFLFEQISENNIDPVTGMIQAGYYLLNRIETKNVVPLIEIIVNKLEELAVVNEAKQELFWYNNFHDKNTLELQLGFTHGIAGIINFLLSVYEREILPKKVEKLIIQGLNFLIKQKAPKGVNLFPFEALNNSFIDYQNLCYGDLGIGFVFFRAGNILNSVSLSKLGIKVIENSAHFRDDADIYIKDANLLYGTSGLLSFFKTMSKLVDSKNITEACDYWLKKTMAHNHHKTKWLGYSSYYNNHSEATQLCFSEGICGIGVSLIAQEIITEGDYLTFLNYNI